MCIRDRCGDTGVITGTNNGVFVVEDTIHLQGGKIGHVGHMTSGMLAAGETVTDVYKRQG